MEKNSTDLEKGFQLMEEDFANFNKELEVVQSCTKNIDNLIRKNNLCMRGLCEKAEGKDLKTFVELFVDLSNPGSNFVITIESAFRFGPLRGSQKTHPSRDILIRFPDWENKALALQLISRVLELKEYHIDFFCRFKHNHHTEMQKF